MIKQASNWALRRIHGQCYTDLASPIGYALCHGVNGQSMPIVSVDPANQRVTTQSGSVYQLGTPNLGFAAVNLTLMRALGFMH